MISGAISEPGTLVFSLGLAGIGSYPGTVITATGVGGELLAILTL